MAIDAFVAEIRAFGFNFAPTGWAQYNGQLMPISQNTALFALLGTMYGGDGKSTFALPNLQGSAPMHAGTGPGLSSHTIGEQGGSETVTLLSSEIPVHTHTVRASGLPGESPLPAGNVPSAVAGETPYRTSGTTTQLAVHTPATAGGSAPHNNMMPSLVVNFCIALQGIFPPRS